MLRPFLLIGVGGSGGKTLRVLHDDLLRRLQQAGWNRPMPRAWQFLHIDVPTVADGNDPDLPGQLPERDYQGLVANGLDYKTIDAAMTAGGGRRLQDSLGGWRPDPSRVNIPASKGAGQFRSLGRVITLAGLDRVRDALQTARRQLSGAEVIGELQEVSAVLGGTPGTNSHEPTVIVISSMAGGSGSGAVIDVCDAVRAMGDRWADEIVGVLYAPDVFDYLPEEARRGIRPNSLAALAELLSGYWNNDGPSVATTELFSKYGVQVGASRRLGPRYPFLVGARNDNVSYQTQNDIYRAMGRSLASWVTSPVLQDRLSAYIQTQWAATAQSVPDKLPLHSQGTETPFVALGSARVGLGRDRFRDFASEHLARTAAERFIERHEQLRRRDDDRPERQLVQETADAVFGGFLTASGLDERGEDRNQVIDALRPETLKADLRGVYDSVLSTVQKSIPDKGRRADDVRRQIRNALQDRQSNFQTTQIKARTEAGRRWVKEIQPRLIALAAKQIGQHGAPVTAELLRRLSTEVSQVREELRAEAAAQRRWAADVEQQIRSALDDTDTAVILSTTDRLSEAVKRAVQTFAFEQEAEIRDLATGLMPDLAANFLEPLTEAVLYGAEAISAGTSVANWAAGDVVPERLRPAPNEFLLEGADDYPSLLDDLVVRTIGPEAADAARPVADMQVLLGAEDLESNGQGLIQRESPWIPQNHLLQASVTDAPTRASFRLAASPADLLQRASDWLNRPGTAVGRYMAEGLREYLDPDAVGPAELTKRLQRFEGQLIAALNAGAPLVSINASVLVQVHDRHEVVYSTSFSEIPLPDRSPARERLRKVLEARGQWTESVAKAFSDNGGSYIDVFTVLGEPYEPVVFNSIMRPVASEWGARSTSPDQRAEFWRWRRSRPLSEALPFSPAVLRQMIRGWFVAGLLKELTVDESGASIYVPAERGSGGVHAAFPWPTLTSVKPNGPDLLPALLESVSLALLQVNVSESLAPMAPYRRLLELGAGNSDEVPAELEKWVLEGPDTSGSAVLDWEARRDDIAKHLTVRSSRFQDHFDRMAQRTELLGFSGSYELRDEILGSLNDLQRAVTAMQPVAAGEDTYF